MTTACFIRRYAQGYGTENKDICYPHLSSATRSAAHGPDKPMPKLPKTLNTSSSDAKYNVTACIDVDFRHKTHSESRFVT